MRLRDQGHINLHKTQTPSSLYQNHFSDSVQNKKSSNATTYGGSIAWQSNRRSSPYTRPTGRAGKPASNAHRNRSLILNKTTNNSQIPKEFAESANGSIMSVAKSEENDNEPLNSPMSWVTKRDRHMQLINSSIFNKETQMRNKAIDHTRRQKLFQRDLREKSKIQRHLAGLSKSAPTNVHEILINGLAFQVVNGGSKLCRAQSKLLNLVYK